MSSRPDRRGRSAYALEECSCERRGVGIDFLQVAHRLAPQLLAAVDFAHSSRGSPFHPQYGGEDLPMAKEYLERLTALMRQASAGYSRKVSLECKHFFSGAAVYANGKICMSLTPAGFAIKLPEKSRRALLRQASAKPLRYFPKGPIKKEYVVLPRTILSDVRAFRRLVRASVEYRSEER